MDINFILIVSTVVLIIMFDYTNGFHDASNILGTLVASRAMTPAQGVILVGIFHFIGPILGGTAVANTIGKFVEVGNLPSTLSITVIFCSICGAVAWNLVTWWFGMPSSSSHALVGGLIGGVVAAAGAGHVVWGFQQLASGHVTGVTKVLLSLLLSPPIGFVVGYIIHKLMRILLRGARPSANLKIKHAQWLTAAGLSFAHGANDAQKSMGIITLVLLLGGHISTFQVPMWVILVCAFAITMGTISGGWRIVRTIGFGIYRIRTLHALDAQLTSGGVIFLASLVGAPVSTTHVVSSSIMGIGASEWPKAVRWGKAQEILGTWIITIPGSAFMAAVLYIAVKMVFGIESL
ncbi:MAG: inorganic phosphate transporter [Magnetococcales bacterium]|nr:inorganic phosphate transporter [Magnetococcales bacterium]